MHNTKYTHSEFVMKFQVTLELLITIFGCKETHTRVADFWLTCIDLCLSHAAMHDYVDPQSIVSALWKNHKGTDNDIYEVFPFS